MRHARLLYCALYCLLTDEEQAVAVASQTWRDVHRLRAAIVVRSRSAAFYSDWRRRIAVQSSVTWRLWPASPGAEARHRSRVAGGCAAPAARQLSRGRRAAALAGAFAGRGRSRAGRHGRRSREAGGGGEEQLALAGLSFRRRRWDRRSGLYRRPRSTIIARAVLPAVERSFRPPMTSALLLSGLLLCLGLVLSLSLFWVHLRR